MAGVKGLEPSTSAVTGQRSNQLSYTPNKWGAINLGIHSFFASRLLLIIVNF